ncbi:hypothetical protein [Arthrobacter globiformis]|uniref:hypothetical protein n=1 Tax=Arthrobacter globiformis TaxID=1665 RepID=UPI00277E3C72|nr:hypothetical protein [Arthrobacter globiformis]MDQ0863500.1 hypothetical protein [Arthrobacter globiformis]
MTANEPTTGLGRIAHTAKLRADMIKSALELKEYLEQIGRFPRGTEPAYARLTYFRKLWDQNTPVPHEVAALLDFADTLPKPRQLAHGQRLEEYRHFIAENRRLPSKTRPAKEASLARWAEKLKKEGALKNTDIRDSLLALIAETKQQTWDYE